MTGPARSSSGWFGKNGAKCDEDFDDPNLQIYAPRAIYCRYSEVKLQSYSTQEKASTNNNPKTVGSVIIPKEVLETVVTKNVPKPSIDVMKRIIMKIVKIGLFIQKIGKNILILFVQEQKMI